MLNKAWYNVKFMIIRQTSFQAYFTSTQTLSERTPGKLFKADHVLISITTVSISRENIIEPDPDP